MFRQPLYDRRRRELDRYVAHDEPGDADARGGSSQGDRAVVARLDQRITVRIHFQHPTPQRVQHDFEAWRSRRVERHDCEPGPREPLGESGLGLGLAAVLTHSPLLFAVTQWLRPLGTLFLNLLSMVVIPLVATALFAGVAGLGDLRRVGRVGIRTLAFFWGTTLAAILIGFVVAALLLPLAPITPDQQAALRQAAAADSGAVRHAAEQITTGARVIVELIPSNPVRAAVVGNLLPLIVFVTIFGVAAAALPDEKRHALTDLADVAPQALIRRVRWVLLLAPLGIFAIVAGAVAHFGVQLVEIMAVFILTVIVGLAVLICAVYLPVVALVARIHPPTYLRAIRASLVMAFSTTSSLATLPVMLEAAESDLRISRTVASFVLPLGASIGRTGSALFQAVALLFMARLYGVPLGLWCTVQAGVPVFLAW